MDPEQDEIRRQVARTMLDALKDTNFVLTGASALMEHGLIHRPTKDVDLFTIGEEGSRISDAIPLIREALSEQGASIAVGREFPGFVDERISWGDYEIGFDLGADWRAYPAARMEIGPMLDARDSVGSKVAALYSRSEARDYMDVAEIVLDGRWSSDEIIEIGISNDPGLDKQMLATVLHPQNSRFPDTEDFQSMGFDRSSELSMREALTVLRYAAQGEHVDLEAVEASRVAMPGRSQSLREQLAHPSSHASPRPKVPGATRGKDSGLER